MNNNNEFHDDLHTSLTQALAIARQEAKPSLKDLLLSDMARTDELVAPRKREDQNIP